MVASGLTCSTMGLCKGVLPVVTLYCMRGLDGQGVAGPHAIGGQVRRRGVYQRTHRGDMHREGIQERALARRVTQHCLRPHSPRVHQDVQAAHLPRVLAMTHPDSSLFCLFSCPGPVQSSVYESKLLPSWAGRTGICIQEPVLTWVGRLSSDTLHLAGGAVLI